jgi:Na+/glutamate symporter
VQRITRWGIPKAVLAGVGSLLIILLYPLIGISLQFFNSSRDAYIFFLNATQ